MIRNKEQQKKRAEELAEEYSKAPLSQREKDSVIRFKGDNLAVIQEIQRLAYITGYLAAVEEYEGLLKECEDASDWVLAGLGGMFNSTDDKEHLIYIKLTELLQKLRAGRSEEK